MAKQRIGFDIGEASLKMVLVSGKEIRKIVTAQMPDHMVENGRILSMDAVADFIRKTAKENNLPKAEAAVILPEAEMFTRTVTVPLMTEQQLFFNLPFEFKDYLDEEKRNYLFDYAVNEIINDEEGNPSQMRLFACAVRKETMENYRMMFKRAGFKLKLAVPQESAYTNIIRNVDTSIGRDCCIADLGHASVRMHFFHDGEYATRRVVDMGLKQLDDLIADAKDMDVHMAHTYKEQDVDDVLSQDFAMNLYGALAVEIAKAVNFFNYNNRSAELNDIYLCGGGALIQPLIDSISETTHMQIHSAEELVPGASGTDASLILRGYGLAIGE